MLSTKSGVLFSLCLSAVSCGPAASLSAVQKQVFTPSCAFGSCHNPPRGAGNLVLNADAFSKLVNVPSTAVPTMMLVVPGSPEKSFLYKKLAQTTEALKQENANAGERMPPGEGLDAARLQLVRDWIAAGAKND